MPFFSTVKQGVHASGTKMGAETGLTAADKNVKRHGKVGRKAGNHSPLAAKSRKRTKMGK